MPLIKYVQHNGTTCEADVPVGNSVMQGAIDNMIDGIVAECGGACICATCHCVVEDAWTEQTGTASSEEDMMLEAASGRRENSRLSCQIVVTEDMEGLTVQLPESQY